MARLDSTHDSLGVSSGPLLSVQGLHVSVAHPHGRTELVRDASFDVSAGEIVGLVGESGSGKSLTALAIMRLLEAPVEVRGRVLLNGRDLLLLRESQMRGVRGADVTMAFQEPMTALDPMSTVGAQLAETVRAHNKVSAAIAWRAAVDMLALVGIPLPDRRAREYPHQLSGGMRQRVMVAMALICEPQLLIADEPTTAVDVTIQAQILELVRNLSQDMGTAVIFITHDLGVVAELCSRVMTMYAGEIVESGAIDSVMPSPAHPYTSALLQATPAIQTRRFPLSSIPGRLPDPQLRPEGCQFHPRCVHAIDECRSDQELRALAAPNRAVRCWRSEALTLPGASA